jgi:hypothetical protein
MRPPRALPSRHPALIAVVICGFWLIEVTGRGFDEG